MPYIAVKGYPKDEETKKEVVEEINAVFLKYWGCPQKAIKSISLYLTTAIFLCGHSTGFMMTITI